MNILLCLGVIFFSMFAFNCLMSDISGEYTLVVTGRQLARVTLFKRSNSLTGQMDTGRGALLDLVTNDLPTSEQVYLIFKTRQADMRKGEKSRQIIFNGTIKDGIMRGEFQEGKKTFKVRLEKNGMDSLFRQIQVLFP